MLTSEFATGKSLEEAAHEAPELRRKYAETLWRFVFKGNLIGSMFNADPHPGNYLFMPDGQITFSLPDLMVSVQQRLLNPFVSHLRGSPEALAGKQGVQF